MNHLLVILLSFVQTTLVPAGLVLPLLIYKSVFWERGTLLINLLIASFLIDLLGNLPFGAALTGLASVLLLFSLINDFFKLSKVQIMLISIVTPLILELILKIYLTLLL